MEKENAENMIGKTFGKLIVIAFSHINEKSKKSYYLCKCECSNNYCVRKDHLKSGKIQSCGKCIQNNAIGKKFGKLTIISFSHKNTNGNSYFNCECDCGNKKIASYNRLKNGSTKSCGKCIEKEMIGKIFGKLTVIKVSEKTDIYGSTYFVCNCECGNTSIDVKASRLRSENTETCGRCYEREMIGKKFGKLTVMRLSEKKHRVGKKYFECKCDCGTESFIALGDSLSRGNTKTCGRCFEKEVIGKRFGLLQIIASCNNKNKTQFLSRFVCKCDCGKTNIEAGLRDLLRGHKISCGCVKHYTQDMLQKICEKILNKNAQHDYMKIDWLKNPKTNKHLQIDIYFPELKLAIEYNGLQHYKKSFKNIDNELEKTKERDRIKKKLIKEHIKNSGKDIEHFIIFTYKDKINEENVLKKLKNFV